MTEKEIIERVKSSMSEKRFLHTEGCVKMAERLSLRWGENAALARRCAYLHDIAKEMPYAEQLKLLDERGIILTDIERSREIIHAFSGAVIAERDFGEPEEVCSAIRWHTTAKSGMTLLEKIIWLSDLIEEGRSFEGVEEIRRLAFENLSSALLKGFDRTLLFLIENGSRIDTNMVDARNFVIENERIKNEEKTKQ